MNEFSCLLVCTEQNLKSKRVQNLDFLVKRYKSGSSCPYNNTILIKQDSPKET